MYPESSVERRGWLQEATGGDSRGARQEDAPAGVQKLCEGRRGEGGCKCGEPETVITDGVAGCGAPAEGRDMLRDTRSRTSTLAAMAVPSQICDGNEHTVIQQYLCGFKLS